MPWVAGITRILKPHMEQSWLKNAVALHADSVTLPPIFSLGNVIGILDERDYAEARFMLSLLFINAHT